MASGVAVRLFRCGFPVAMTELQEPLTVRRTVSFAQAIYSQQAWVEGIEARRAEGYRHTMAIQEGGAIPIVIDPEARLASLYHPSIIVDATMTKSTPAARIGDALLVVGLGPGFEAGVHSHFVVETRRGHALGRLYDKGWTLPMDGIPDGRGGASVDRVLRAPIAGSFRPRVEIGDRVEPGGVIGEVEDEPVIARTAGLVRGLLWPGVKVPAGEKVGDVDPVAGQESIRSVSDKALAVGGGVLEAILRHFGPPVLSNGA